jgi:hypothetical protein
MNKIYILAELFFLGALRINAQITLTQTTNNTVTDGAAFNNGVGYGVTYDNIYYRAFNLNTLGYSSFEITEVEFGIARVANASAGFAVEVVIYSTDNFPSGTLTELTSTSVPIFNSDSFSVKSVPIAYNFDSCYPILVFGIRVPNEVANGNSTVYYPGMNQDGETAPSYISSASQGYPDPVSYADINYGQDALVMNVKGNAGNLFSATTDLITGLRPDLRDLIINNNTMYFTEGADGSADGGRVSKIDYTNQNPVPIVLLNNLVYPYGLMINNNDMYIGHEGGISKFDITEPTPSLVPVITFTGNSTLRVNNMILNGNELYWSTYDYPGIGKISKIDITATTPTITDVVVVSGFPDDMVLSGDFIYYSDFYAGKISKIDITVPTPTTPIDLVTGLGGPSGLLLIGDFLYIMEYISNLVSKININSANPIPVNIVTGLNTPNAIVNVGDDFYVAEWLGGKILKFTETKFITVAWNGLISSDWDDPNNWTPNLVPNRCSKITIPITPNTPAITGISNIYNLDINSGSNVEVPAGTTLNILDDLNMDSASNSYSGLVVNGTISVAGTSKYKRYTNSQLNDNDLISPPLDGQSWSSFLTSDSNYNANILFTDGVAEPNTTYLFGPFEKSDTDNYLVYNYNDTVTLDSGKGYRVATNTVANDGNGEPLIFTGSILTGSVDAAIENDITGNFHEWNLIGNPYPAYIDVNTFLNHVGSVSGVTNLSLLDESTAAIYGYDADETDTTGSNWTITNLMEGPALIAPGQGFFVSSKNASATLEFTTAMQVVGNSDDFIQGRTSQPTDFIKLKATTATNSSSISVYFHESASAGLDIGYDAAVFGGSISEFGLYSHLVQDNEGIPIAIQTLNTDAINNVIIPLGMHTNQGEQLTFSLEDSHIPSSVEVYLEDTLTNTFTLLNTSSYTLTPSTNLSDTGRFFLRFTANALSIGTPSFNTINIYSNQSDRSIIIEGILQRETEVAVYDLLGRKVLQQGLDAALSKHTMNASTLSSGVYVVTLQDGNEQLTKKVIIK